MAPTMVGGTGSLAGLQLGILPRGFLLANRYEIEQPLGAGGMGMVYRARDIVLDVQVALKMIRSEYVDNERILERFKQEINIARKVTHRNVARIYDLGETDGLRYISMEYIEGKDLSKIIEEKGRLSVEESLPVLRQVCAALREAHAVGVVHRDLKPQNVMVDAGGCARVMDFGIAMSADLQGMTRTGALIGTPEYMSPEQAEGRKVDHRSDIYSLGILMYELLSGDAPFKGDTTWEVIRKQIEQKPRTIRKDRPEIPEWLDTLILKCLEKDTALRYQSVVAILADLDRQEAHLSARHYLPSRRHVTLAGVALTLIVVAVAITMVLRPRAPVAGTGGRRSVAILPFENLTGRADLEWLRTGLADNLTTDLAESRYFRVLSRERLTQILHEIRQEGIGPLDASALRKIGEFGAVEAIVTGSFLAADDQLRVNLRLQDPMTGEIFESKRIDRPASQVLAMIDDLTRTTKQFFNLAPDRITSDADLEMAAARTGDIGAASLYQQGVDLLYQSRYLESLDPLQRAVEADPSFAMAHARLAEAHMRTGHDHEALASVRKAMDNLLAHSERLTHADRTFITALDGRINNRPEDSIRAYEEMLKLDPENPYPAFHIGEMHESTGDYAAAEKRYRQAIGHDSKNAALMYALGRVQIRAGRQKEAIEELGRTLALYERMGSEEGQGNALNAIAYAHDKLGDFDRALDFYGRSELIKRKIGDTLGLAKTLDNRAGVLQMRGQLEEARRTEEEALALSREIGDAEQIATIVMNLGSLREESGDPEGMISYYSEALELQRSLKDRSEQVMCLISLGRGEASMGRLEPATGRLTEAAQIADEIQNTAALAQILSEQGQIALLRGDLPHSMALQERAIERWRREGRDDGLAECRFRMAVAQESSGEYAAAREGFEEALKTFSGMDDETNQARVRYGLARLELSLGRADAALRLIYSADEGVRKLANPALAASGGLVRVRALLMKGDHQQAGEAASGVCGSAEKTRVIAATIACGIAKGLVAPASDAVPQALAAATRAGDNGMIPLQAEADLALAQAWLRSGDSGQAAAAARRALKTATRIGLPWVAPAAAVIVARSAREDGDTTVARAALADAMRLIEQSRRGLSADLAASLMARPDVRELVEESGR